MPKVTLTPEEKAAKAAAKAAALLGSSEETVSAPVVPQISAKKIVGYAQGIAVLKIEDYENPVNHLMYKRLHLVDGTTQVLSEAEMTDKDLKLFSLVK